MSISAINAASGNQVSQAFIQKTGGRGARQVQPAKAQGANKVNQGSIVEKGRETQQKNQTAAARSINLYA